MQFFLFDQQINRCVKNTSINHVPQETRLDINRVRYCYANKAHL